MRDVDVMFYSRFEIVLEIAVGTFEPFGFGSEHVIDRVMLCGFTVNFEIVLFCESLWTHGAFENPCLVRM